MTSLLRLRMSSRFAFEVDINVVSLEKKGPRSALGHRLIDTCTVESSVGAEEFKVRSVFTTCGHDDLGCETSVALLGGQWYSKWREGRT